MSHIPTAFQEWFKNAKIAYAGDDSNKAQEIAWKAYKKGLMRGIRRERDAIRKRYPHAHQDILRVH